MQTYLQFKAGESGPFQTVAVEHKEKPLRHHVMGLSYTATGYGSKLPSRYMIRFEGRWYRVYSVCYSNCSTEYVLVDGDRVTVQFNN